MDAMIDPLAMALIREHPERVHVVPVKAPSNSPKLIEVLPTAGEIFKQLDAWTVRAELLDLWSKIEKLRGEIIALDRDPVLGVQRRRLRGSLIIQIVAEKYGRTVEEIIGLRRLRRDVYVRHLAMYLVKNLTPLSLPQIGAVFQRDHTTVMHAVRMVEKRYVADRDFRAEVQELRTTINARKEKR